MERNRTLIAENVAVLLQGGELLDSLSSDVYAREGRFDARSGIGAHFRHCVEFYASFLDGVRSGRVDYGARPRDRRLERDRELARNRMWEIANALDALDGADAEAPLVVRAEGVAHDEWSCSSVGRELQVLSSHTVHHFALVALLLRLEGVEPPEEFGVAPSTLEYWRSQECAR